ncbi:MAG: carboxypeptidase-like regulatory domain-containing protein, partial [Fibrobacter sp.]|nr:carboxypeptidase-like regulatory domain-containing protein [Fibrobacter sp.]
KEEGKALVRATLQLYRLGKKDTTFVGGTYSDERGAFVFNSVRSGRYLLKATFLGYKPLMHNVNVSNQTTALGNLVMEADAVLLKEAVVTANVPKSQVRHGQERVRRAFHKERLHIGSHLGIERRQVGRIFNRVSNAEVLENLVQNAEGATIHIARNYNLVALVKKRKHSRGCRHAACKSKSRNTTFEFCD